MCQRVYPIVSVEWTTGDTILHFVLELMVQLASGAYGR